MILTSLHQYFSEFVDEVMAKSHRQDFWTVKLSYVELFTYLCVLKSCGQPLQLRLPSPTSQIDSFSSIEFHKAPKAVIGRLKGFLSIPLLCPFCIMDGN